MANQNGVRAYHCGFDDCGFRGLLSVMFNVDIAVTDGRVRPLCRPHKDAVEAEGVRTYPLENTLKALAKRAEERREAQTAEAAAEVAAKKAAEREKARRFLSGTLRVPVAAIIRHSHRETAARIVRRVWHGTPTDAELAFGRCVATHGY